MTTQEVKRKLTAILSADVKGYSRLMGEDEVGTIRTLNTYKEVMAGLIQHHHGRVVDAPGDNLLAEFAIVVDAVQCGVEIQKELKTRNAELPENRKMEFRIGVNLGDVIEEGEHIYGVGRYEEAIAVYKKALQLSPTNAIAHQGLAATYAQLGRSEDARFHIQELLRLNPKFSLHDFLERGVWKERATMEHWLEGLRKAGLK